MHAAQYASTAAFLASQGIALHLAAALATILQGVYADGFWIGTRSAQAAATGSDAVNWGGWKPGTGTGVTSRLIEQVGEEAAYRGVTAKIEPQAASIASSRLRELARIMTDAAARGETADRITELVRANLEDPGRAYRIALTELVSAQSAATVAAYQKAGVREHVWASAEDDKVCPACDANAAAGAVQVGMPFPSGDAAPPIHPQDRCALLPVLR